MYYFLSIWDIFLTPIFFVILVSLAKRQRDRRYDKTDPRYKYFMPGLYAKFAGAMFIGLIYQFYYGEGDTSHYFRHAEVINSALGQNIGLWFKLMTHAPVSEDPRLYQYTEMLAWYDSGSPYTVARITALLGLLCGTTYMPIALMFAFLSYTGIWAMFSMFSQQYPKLIKQLAICFLFIPSVVVWGSSIFKDTVCMFGLGWITYCTFQIFIYRNFQPKNLLMLALGFYLVATIKVYIVMAFVPAISLWILMTYSQKVRNAGLRWIINIAFITVNVFGFMYLTTQFAKELDKYSLENIAATSTVTKNWIAYASARDQGSAYDLGDFDPTLTGMLSKFPQAVVVSLFRPFPWEARKVIVVLSALEALLFLIYTVNIFQPKHFKSTVRLILRDANVQFFFIFSIIFAFAVGISSYNFGALSRYKIPCLPFYAAFIFIVQGFHKAKKEEEQERWEQEMAARLRHQEAIS